MRRSNSYIMTIDPMSVSDIEKLAVVKRTVSIGNRRTFRKFQVRLMPRGPRRVNAIADGKRKWSYDSYLPLRYATRIDVYIHERY
jgi:hypothetical protein